MFHTNKGETKSLKWYVTSNGFNFSIYNLFKPSTTEVTAVRGIFALKVKKKDYLREVCSYAQRIQFLVTF
jgi:hypothetical protein